MGSVVERLSNRWLVPVAILEDVYALLTLDPRFYSAREPYGVQYTKMASRLKVHYRVEVNERQLRYLVKMVKWERNKLSLG